MLLPSRSVVRTILQATESPPKGPRAPRVDTRYVVRSSPPASRWSKDRARSMIRDLMLPDEESRLRRNLDSHCPTQPAPASHRRAIHKLPTAGTPQPAPTKRADRTQYRRRVAAMHR